MSRRGYRRHGRGGLSTAVDNTAHLAASFGPVGALCTGAIGFAVFYTVLPLCMMGTNIAIGLGGVGSWPM